MTVVQRLEGSAYRKGRLVCARVAVSVVADAPSPRHVGVRFLEGVHGQLRDELERLMERRGAFAARLAEQLDPVEIVGCDADCGRQWRLVGRLERPAARYRPITDVDFWLCASTEPDGVRWPGAAGEPVDDRASRRRTGYDRSARRLGAAEVRAIRRACQSQLKRWTKAEQDPENQRRCAELRHALRVLRQVRGGCELHPICHDDDESRGSR